MFTGFKAGPNGVNLRKIVPVPVPVPAPEYL